MVLIVSDYFKLEREFYNFVSEGQVFTAKSRNLWTFVAAKAKPVLLLGFFKLEKSNNQLQPHKGPQAVLPDCQYSSPLPFLHAFCIRL